MNCTSAALERAETKAHLCGLASGFRVLTGAGGEQDPDAAGPRAFRMGLRLVW